MIATSVLLRMGRTYEFQIERRADGTVAIVLDHHEHVSPGAGPLVLTQEQYGKWFVKG